MHDVFLWISVIWDLQQILLTNCVSYFFCFTTDTVCHRCKPQWYKWIRADGTLSWTVFCSVSLACSQPAQNVFADIRLWFAEVPASPGNFLISKHMQVQLHQCKSFVQILLLTILLWMWEAFQSVFVHPTLYLITFRVHFPFLSKKLLTNPCLMTPQVPEIASVIN